jgi:hypothetical protein
MAKKNIPLGPTAAPGRFDLRDGDPVNGLNDKPGTQTGLMSRRSGPNRCDHGFAIEHPHIKPEPARGEYDGLYGRKESRRTKGRVGDFQLPEHLVDERVEFSISLGCGYLRLVAISPTSTAGTRSAHRPGESVRTEATPTSIAEMIMGPASTKWKGRFGLAVSICAQIVPKICTVEVRGSSPLSPATSL